MNDAFLLILIKSLWQKNNIKRRKERLYLKEDRKVECMWQSNFNYLITNSSRDAGERGRRICRAGELCLDVVGLYVVLAAAEVCAGGRDPHLDAAGQVVPAVRHALRDHREVRLAVRRTHSCHTGGILN
jgi:hypothetical protein